MRIKHSDNCYINYGKDDINEQHRKINGELREEIKRLENNWNKLKDFIEKNVVCLKSGNLLVELNVDKLYKILELESGNSDE